MNPKEYPGDKKMTKLEIKTQIYNEQLEQLCRLEIDDKFYDELVLMYPDDGNIAKNRLDNRENLKKKVKLIALLEKELDEEREKAESKN